jgi:hypothetical protein
MPSRPAEPSIGDKIVSGANGLIGFPLRAKGGLPTKITETQSRAHRTKKAGFRQPS